MPLNDPKDKAIEKAANAQKRNLDDGADVHVPTGDEATPTGRVNPNDARKAMFKSADAIRDAQAAEGGSIQDERLRILAKEAGIDLAALEAGHTGDPAQTATTTPTAPANDRTLHLNKDKTDAAASTQTSQSRDAYVTVHVNGAEVKVAQRDIDRAGGAEQYAFRREMEEQRNALARQQADLQRQLEEMTKLRQELQQGATHSAGHGNDPANRAASPAAQDRNDPGTTGVEDDRLAERLAEQIYSGDQDEAKKGILELIRLARSRGEVPNVAAIVQQVRTELGAAPDAEGNKQPTTPTPVIDPVIERTHRAINDMAKAEYGELMENAAGRAAAYQRFLELVQKPENAQRLALDIAREACEEIEPKFVNRRQAVVERKRGLQATSAASAQRAEDEDTVETDPSAIVAQMAASRSFGRRPQK